MKQETLEDVHTGDMVAFIEEIKEVTPEHAVFKSMYADGDLHEESIEGHVLEIEVSSQSSVISSGNIPKEVGNLSQLAFLSLIDNQLTGSIPTSLFNISSLLVLSLRNNILSGPLLLNEGNIVSNLNLLSISYNQISGCIPSNICQLTELKVLSISFNNIAGDIPRNIGCLSKLEKFYMGDNPIKGTIPTSLGNISTLHDLYCQNNRIVGGIPPELGKLSNLRQLTFDNNSNLIGQIPEAIFNISSLEVIGFTLNNLSGRIPTTTGLHLPNLKVLELGVNQLEGEIPLFIANASKLQKLELNNNFLTGTIPNNLGNLRELQALLLHTNQLTNEPRERELLFFNSLADCKMLRYLQVGKNPLNGILPNSIGNLSSTIENIYIGYAHINGLIPTNVGNMSGLTVIDIQGNNLTGSIPSEIGTIPKSLEKLSYLKSINVSFNDLEGEIPSGGVFANSTLQSFLGNKGLCGMHILEIPACAITNPGKQSKLREVLLKFVTPVVIASFLIFLLVSIWIMKRQKKGKSKEVEKVLEIGTHQLVSYHEIQRATNNFDESNLIGEGSSGSVYKGTLFGGTAVAIKVLHLDNEQVCKRFDTKCKVTRNVRHRNLVPVITTCSSDYIRAFVLQFMPNGKYGSEGIVSTSGDVYSYGIMLMEVLTKRRPTDEEIGNENLDLRKWIIQSFSGSMMDVVDVNLFSEEEEITSKSEMCIASMIELGLDCTKETPESRVTMKEVVKRLNKINNTFLET
uniref:Serine-threonine protein kinase, plant-type n=1 Tax=Solanum tuberosum TaxID=4113 RepID=M1B3F1_SOLTU